MSFQIIRDNIINVRADAIVISANPQPVFAGGTDLAVYRVEGKKLLTARQKIGEIGRGEAAVTPAHRLKAKHIIHTVAPVWEGGAAGEFEILQRCYENSLRLAWELGCVSIAIPLLAAGVYGYPKDQALQIGMDTIQTFLVEHEMQVILVVFDRDAFQLSGQVVDSVRAYVDDHYVEEVKQKESRLFAHEFRATKCAKIPAPMEACPNEAVCLDEAPLPSPVEPMMAGTAPQMAASAPSVNASFLDPFADLQKTFQEKLFEIIDERGLTGPQVYKNYISKQVYSKIQSDREYRPNKYTALALCLSLNLSVEQTLDLIGRAGLTLSPSSKMDLVVKACIINHEYNIVKINCILFDYNLPEMEKIR